MQEVVEKAKREKSEKPTKPEAQRGASMITAPRFDVLSVPIVNMAGSPLVIHAFSQKARDMKKDKQQAGSQPVKNPGGRRAPKDFEAVYQGARYISTEGWDGASAAGFRNSMIGACRLLGYKMTIGKMAVSIRVVSDSDTAVDAECAIRRTLAGLGSAVLGLGFVPAFFDSEHRAFHDRVAHTRVVALRSV